jgi:hypothetical protein
MALCYSSSLIFNFVKPDSYRNCSDINVTILSAKNEDLPNLYAKRQFMLLVYGVI